jgi:hypothetical protein
MKTTMLATHVTFDVKVVDVRDTEQKVSAVWVTRGRDGAEGIEVIDDID